MINNVVLVGRLTKDCELTYTNSGAAVGTFSLAVQRSFTNQNGDREADFISCVIWRKSAESLANYTRKGSLIGVEGRIQTRNYENQQGNRVYVTEVICESYQMLETKEVNEQRKQESSQSNQQSNQKQQQESSFKQEVIGGMNEYGTNITDDDLPF